MCKHDRDITVIVELEHGTQQNKVQLLSEKTITRCSISWLSLCPLGRDGKPQWEGVVEGRTPDTRCSAQQSQSQHGSGKRAQDEMTQSVTWAWAYMHVQLVLHACKTCARKPRALGPYRIDT